MAKKQKWLVIAAVAFGGVLVLASAGWFIMRPVLNFGIDPATAPKFVKANVVDLQNYGGVSKFRSGAGHDFSGGGETCRSMKHYFMPKDSSKQLNDPSQVPAAIDPASNLPIFSPVDGEITAIQNEQFPLGKQIYIRPTGNESYTVRLFHVYPLGSLKTGGTVTAGERIGSVLPYQQTDVAVQVMTLAGPQFISYFNVMDPAVLALYKDRGADGAEDFIIPRDVRDADPLTCNGEEFTEKDTSNADHWFFFNDFAPEIYQEPTDS